MRKARRTAVAVAMTLLLAGGIACIKKTSGAVTPMERLTTDNALFAEANNTLEKGTEAAAASLVITNQQAAPVIAFTGEVAAIHLQITAVINQGTQASANSYAKVSALLDQINASASTLIASGQVGFKSPRSQQLATVDVNTITQAGKAILRDIQALQPSVPAASGTQSR